MLDRIIAADGADVAAAGEEARQRAASGETLRAIAAAYVTANRAQTVIWRCPDFPGLHPDYPMSPRARVKVEIGCPVCRQIRSANRRRKPKADDPRLAA